MKFKISSISLQQKIEGIEIAAGRFFNGNSWIGPVEINIEHKKLFPGDLGPTTSEMGTIAWYTNNEHNKLFQETLVKIKSYLRKINYKGYIDINCIVNNKGAFPLEATARLGSPIIHLQSEIHKSPWGEFLKAVADGKPYNLKWRKGYGIVVVVTVPTSNPFPFTKAERYVSPKGLKIYFDKYILKKENFRHIHFEDVSVRFVKGKKEYYISDDRGYVLYVTAMGKTVEEARKKAFAALVSWLLLTLFVCVAARAADLPYTLAIAPTGEPRLDQAIEDASQLVRFKDRAPVGPFALIARAEADAARIDRVLRSFGHYDAVIVVRIAGLASGDARLLPLLEGLPGEPPGRWRSKSTRGRSTASVPPGSMGRCLTPRGRPSTSHRAGPLGPVTCWRPDSRSSRPSRRTGSRWRGCRRPTHWWTTRDAGERLQAALVATRAGRAIQLPRRMADLARHAILTLEQLAADEDAGGHAAGYGEVDQVVDGLHRHRTSVRRARRPWGG